MRNGRWPLRLERRTEPSMAMSIASPLIAAAAMLVTGFILFSALGESPAAVFHVFFIEPVASLYGIGELLQRRLGLARVRLNRVAHDGDKLVLLPRLRGELRREVFQRLGKVAERLGAVAPVVGKRARLARRLLLLRRRATVVARGERWALAMVYG